MTDFHASATAVDLEWGGVRATARTAAGDVAAVAHEDVILHLQLRAADFTGLDLTKPVTVSQPRGEETSRPHNSLADAVATMNGLAEEEGVEAHDTNSSSARDKHRAASRAYRTCAELVTKALRYAPEHPADSPSPDKVSEVVDRLDGLADEMERLRTFDLSAPGEGEHAWETAAATYRHSAAVASRILRGGGDDER